MLRTKFDIDINAGHSVDLSEAGEYVLQSKCGRIKTSVKTDETRLCILLSQAQIVVVYGLKDRS